MRAISLLVFLITLWVGGCVTWPLDMVALHGTYDLISYEGKELPVDLSNGQVLVDGYCALNVRRDRLTVYLDYEGDAFGEPNPAYLTGALTFEDDLDEQGPKRGQFVSDKWYLRGLGGVITPDFIYEAPVSVDGDILRVGTEEDHMAFRKRRN